jgi:hypothetical protein
MKLDQVIYAQLALLRYIVQRLSGLKQLSLTWYDEEGDSPISNCEFLSSNTSQHLETVLLWGHALSGCAISWLSSLPHLPSFCTERNGALLDRCRKMNEGVQM